MPERRSHPERRCSGDRLPLHRRWLKLDDQNAYVVTYRTAGGEKRSVLVTAISLAHAKKDWSHLGSGAVHVRRASQLDAHLQRKSLALAGRPD